MAVEFSRVVDLSPSGPTSHRLVHHSASRFWTCTYSAWDHQGSPSTGRFWRRRHGITTCSRGRCLAEASVLDGCSLPYAQRTASGWPSDGCRPTPTFPAPPLMRSAGSSRTSARPGPLPRRLSPRRGSHDGDRLSGRGSSRRSGSVGDQPVGWFLHAQRRRRHQNCRTSRHIL